MGSRGNAAGCRGRPRTHYTSASVIAAAAAWLKLLLSAHCCLPVHPHQRNLRHTKLAPALSSSTPWCAHFSRLPCLGTAKGRQGWAHQPQLGRSGTSHASAQCQLHFCKLAVLKLLQGSWTQGCQLPVHLPTATHHPTPPDTVVTTASSSSAHTLAPQVLLQLLVHVAQAAGDGLALQTEWLRQAVSVRVAHAAGDGLALQLQYTQSD